MPSPLQLAQERRFEAQARRPTSSAGLQRQPGGRAKDSARRLSNTEPCAERVRNLTSGRVVGVNGMIKGSRIYREGR